jgi:hypothetical protein
MLKKTFDAKSSELQPDGVALLLRSGLAGKKDASERGSAGHRIHNQDLFWPLASRWCLTILTQETRLRHRGCD